MTRLYFFATLFLISFSSLSEIQAQNDHIAKFTASMKAGNIGALIQDLTETVEVNMEGNRQTIAKNEFQSFIQNFFTKHPMNSFELNHTGSSGASGFAIGKYIDKNGLQYKVILKTDGDKIEKIDFKKE